MAVSTIDIDAVKARAHQAKLWLDDKARQLQRGDDLPLAVREHFARDVPALLAEVRRLRAERAELDRELTYLKRQHERALQIRDALMVAAREHYENVIYMVSPADDLERPSAPSP